ncbi:MAG TPA: FGGY-family carbohydrate kinase [Spirochaetia bacterium]|nr:FGGY-family carbohydrate kinase [Spirochaetia bacterium]
MAGFLLGIDYGTGGAKGCLADTEGNVLGYAFKEYPIVIQKPSWSEHDPKLYWSIACEIIKECISSAHAHPGDIRAIAVSSALPCMVMVDKNGQAIHNAYNLMDRRATAETQWLKDNIGEREIFRLTGNRVDDHPTLVNLMWERNNRTDSFKRIHKVFTIEGYINFKLTKRPTLVHQNAAFWGVAYNIVEKHFDPGMLEKIGIDPGLIPELRYCDEIIGEVSSEAAEETGLTAGTPVCAGQADFNASCVASGVIKEGDIQSNLGTCGNFGAIHKSTDFLFEMLVLGFTVGSKDTYITIPTTMTGGMSIRYLRDHFSQMEVETERALGVDAYDLLNLEAEKIPLGCEGLVVLPFLMGERTPIWDVNARGCVFGLSLHHSKPHLVRAFMEGVAYAMYDSFRLIKQAGMKINVPIVMHEGGAKSRLWRQIITDVFDTPTVLTKRRVGAPFGDAILAGVAAGIYKDFSISKELAVYVDRMDPIKGNTKIYMEYFRLYKDLYQHVKEDYKTLRNLREGIR